MLDKETLLVELVVILEQLGLELLPLDLIYTLRLEKMAYQLIR
jgi:hypothetical protein